MVLAWAVSAVKFDSYLTSPGHGMTEINHFCYIFTFTEREAHVLQKNGFTSELYPIGFCTNEISTLWDDSVGSVLTSALFAFLKPPMFLGFPSEAFLSIPQRKKSWHLIDLDGHVDRPGETVEEKVFYVVYAMPSWKSISCPNFATLEDERFSEI